MLCNTTLAVLDLGFNPLGNTGFHYLGMALKSEKCPITTLRLNGCFDVTNRGFAYLGNGLAVNGTLRELQLNYSLPDVDHEGYAALLSRLRKNNSLTSLGLDTRMNSLCYQAIEDEMKLNKTILSLNIHDSQYYPEQVSRIELLMARNRIPDAVALELLSRFSETGSMPAEVLKLITLFLPAGQHIRV